MAATVLIFVSALVVVVAGWPHWRIDAGNSSPSDNVIVPIIAQLVLEEPQLLTYRMEQVEIYTIQGVIKKKGEF